MGDAKLCRLCAAEKDTFIGIYEDEGEKSNLDHKINKYLQIELSAEDPLPKSICLDCFSKVNECVDFIELTSQAQITLHMILLQPKVEENDLPLDRDVKISDVLLVNEQDSSASSFEEEPLVVPSPPKLVQCMLTENASFSQLEKSSSEDDDEDQAASLKRRIVFRFNQVTVNCGFAETKPSICQKSKDGTVALLGEEIKLERALEDKDSETIDLITCEVSEDKVPNLEELNESKLDITEDGKQQNKGGSPRKRRDGWEKYPWMCTDCSQELPTMQALRTHHQKVHNQQARFMCAQCSKVYTKYYGFVSHVRRHRNHMKFCCEECGKCFSNKKVLESHRATHSDARPYVCAECGKSFRQQSALYVHNRSHQPDNIKNRYPCDQCDKRFSTKPNLVTHKRIHTGIKNYTCDQCGKSFIQKGNLDAHLLTHSVEKPHTCSICNKGFKTPLQLRKHQTVHTGAKPHQCDVCGRQFRERGTLREHHRIHTGAMPFTCEFCGKSFRFKGILTTHRRQHTGERPYSCLECQHHFTNWPNYNKHMKRRHGINTSHQPDPNKLALSAGATNTNINPSPVTLPPANNLTSPPPVMGPEVQIPYEPPPAHFYNTAPVTPMAPYVHAPMASSMLGFYNIPQMQNMDHTNSMDILHTVQHR